MAREDLCEFVELVSEMRRMWAAIQSLLAQTGGEAFFCCQNDVPFLANLQSRYSRCCHPVSVAQQIESERRDLTRDGPQRVRDEAQVDVPSEMNVKVA